jgi:hypothetical protein
LCCLVQFGRRIDLQITAPGHDGDAVGHGQGFFLVMGYEHKGNTDPSAVRLSVQAASFRAVDREWLIGVGLSPSTGAISTPVNFRI